MTFSSDVALSVWLSSFIHPGTFSVLVQWGRRLVFSANVRAVHFVEEVKQERTRGRGTAANRSALTFSQLGSICPPIRQLFFL